MKTLQRALNIAVCATIACWYFNRDNLEAGIIICLAMIVILPMAYYVRGDDND